MFLLALTYPLPATWLPNSSFDKVHQLSTSTVLNKKGYNRNLPHGMVFALQALGGVCLCPLQYEMEVQQVIILLHHMHAKTQLGQTIEVLIQHY